MVVSRSSRRFAVALAAVLLPAAGLGACTTVAPPRAPAATVEVRWYCWNDIFVPAGGGERWWAGPAPHPTGPLEEVPAPDDGDHEHRATGTLAEHGPTATFTASTGATLALRRVAADAVFPTYCRLSRT